METRKKAEGSKEILKEVMVGEGHMEGFWGAGSFWIWMDLQKHHFKVIL